MYDNLHMRLATVEGQTSTVTNRLSNPKQTIDIDTGECRTFGYLNNLRVSVYRVVYISLAVLQSISTEETFTLSTDEARKWQCRSCQMIWV